MLNKPKIKADLKCPKCKAIVSVEQWYSNRRIVMLSCGCIVKYEGLEKVKNQKEGKK